MLALDSLLYFFLPLAAEPILGAGLSDAGMGVGIRHRSLTCSALSAGPSPLPL